MKIKRSKIDLLHHCPYPIKVPEEYIASGEKYKCKCVTFQKAMKFTVLVGQCFGLNPVLGVTEIDTSKLSFNLTFYWNFSDIFVICISLYLTSRLDQVNRGVVAARGKKVTSSIWRTMRVDCSRATYLVRRVDDVIGRVIFISFANNLFFICLPLLHILEPMKGYETPVYFLYSFVLLVARSLAVSLVGSRVHTASRESVHELYEVPAEVYCVEVQRFLDQIHGDTAALSGLQFFNVKRGLVLTVRTDIDVIPVR